MTNKYIEESSSLLGKILSKIPSKTKKDKAKWLNTFINNFYHLEPEEDLNEVSSDELFNIAANTFDFFYNRKPGEPKVRIFNKSNEKSQYTVIEIINDDMPFLVDSLSEELNRQEINILNIFHPVIAVERDKKGNLTNLISVKKQKKDLKLESVIHFQITHTASKEAQKRILDSLLLVLKATYLAVEDWKPILSKLDYVINQFALSTITLQEKSKGKEKEAIEEESLEVKAFLEWLKDNNFVFLGYIKYDYQKDNPSLIAKKGSELGIFKMPTINGSNKAGKIKTIFPDSLHFVKDKNLIEITKANTKSLVHRNVHMDYIGIKRFDKSGKVIGEHRFLGLFTSQVYYQSAPLIPIIRKKINTVQEMSHFSDFGHSGKALAAVLESFPRDELFQSSIDYLFDTSIGIVALGVRQRVRLFVRTDDFERFVSCLIYIPRERMSTGLRNKMEKILTSAFNGQVSNHYTQITESHLARLQVIIRTKPGKIPNINLKELEQNLANEARLWIDDLYDELTQRFGEKEGIKSYKEYRDSFSVSYMNRFNSEDAYFDIIQIEKVLKTCKTVFDIYENSKEKEVLHLKVYNPNHQISLSEIMPILENMGLEIIAEHTYLVTPKNNEDDIWIHHFRFNQNNIDTSNFSVLKEKFETAIEKIWLSQMGNDGFNKLILMAGLSWREIVLLRSYSNYLKQIRFNYSQEFIQGAFANHPKLTKCIISMFSAKLAPGKDSIAKRQEKIEQTIKTAKNLLSKVSNLSEDRVINVILELIAATNRTNFYQTNELKEFKSYISFKFNSAKISNLPLPKPYAEIFVTSPEVEGIHLRGGKVARGGLRWSDRHEDFRTEVLGLMKAQMTKNAVIVPVGSKGGFVVKHPPKEGGREAFINKGIECYKIFLKGLLDVTDNIVNGKIVTPQNVIKYDDNDPYLVVAADKGTATFSDIANSVANEYNFWLGDAFASGGSAGYDHKKMGITARGAWISVERHFREMGIDTNQQDFTVIGVGDMAGDVFGNGMLLSSHIKLVAAFNHMHIFVDPNPNAAKSYKERERLFKLPSSTWKDYDEKLISKGGGVFERSAKSIKLSKEIKETFSTEESVVTPDEFIRIILKSKVDLLWNGGIGTYIKADFESNESVGDRANDNLRVNANELHARVIGEGGNLGLTQNGRIQYAKLGGRINTDAIDNSAGVDCSDHEVNLKIALNQAVESKKMSLKERNALLEDMTEDVAELVLRDNYLQTQAITIAELQGNALLEMYARFLNRLEKDNILDRKIEFLPSEEEITRRQAEGKGLTRPELSVILAYSKMRLNDEILSSSLPDDPYYKKDLILYFPEKIREKFKKEILSHTLGKEIITTYVINSMINRVGSTFFYQMLEETGVKACDIARAYTITVGIFNLEDLWQEIEGLDGKIGTSTQVELFLEVQTLIERSVLWFLRHLNQPLDVTKTVENFTKGVKNMEKCYLKILSPVASSIYKNRLARLRALEVPEKIASRVASLEALSSSCNVVHVASKYNLPVEKVGDIYFKLGARLEMGWIRKTLEGLSRSNYWQRLSIKTMINNIYDEQMRLTANLIQEKPKASLSKAAIDQWVESNRREVERYDRFISDLKTQDKIDFSMLVIAIKRVEEISEIK